MPKKWNLQDIRPAKERRRRTSQHPEGDRRERERAEYERDHERTSEHREAPAEEEYSSYDPSVSAVEVVDGGSRKRKRVIVASVLAVLLIGAGIGVNLLMGGAEITVHPRFKDVTVSADFVAKKNAGADELSYELLTLEAEGDRQVSASGQEEVSQQATGKIMIYNETDQPQRLIKNTRFESPEGLIFKIEESVEVPAAPAGEAGATGVITAEVFADGPGEQYNIEPTRFTIPGLEGTDLYDRMYAESTEGFTGGFEGNRYIIDDAELKTAKQSLHNELRNTLLERLPEEVPAGFIHYDNAVTFVFESQPATEYGDDLATIRESAMLQVPVFEEGEFAAFIAQATVPGYEGSPVRITDPQALTFSYPDRLTTTTDISDESELPFTLSGSARIVWQYNEDALRNDLLGLSKTAIVTVLKGYPAIDRAEAEVRPFWSQSFPDNVEDIKIRTVVGDESEDGEE